jgi:hypothetical protein
VTVLPDFAPLSATILHLYGVGPKVPTLSDGCTQRHVRDLLPAVGPP